MIDFFGYLFDWYAVIIYLVVFALAVVILRKKGFERKLVFWFSLLAVFCLEFVWEVAYELVKFYRLGVLGDAYIFYVGRMLILCIPVFVWLYYNFAFGIGVASVLLFAGFVIEVCFWHSALVNRLIFAAVVVFNMVWWDKSAYELC